MGRRKKIVTVTEDLDGLPTDPESETVTVEPEISERLQPQTPTAPASLADGMSDIATFLEGFQGDELTVRIYRYTPSGKVEYVGEGGTDLVTERYIQDRWDGGRYRLFVYGPGQAPGKGSSRTINIAYLTEEEKAKKRAKENINNPTPIVQPAAPSSDPTLAIFQIQMENMRAELAASHAMTLKLIEQLGKNSGSSESSMPELVQAIVSLKGLLQPAPVANPMSIISEILPLATKLIDLGAGRESNESSWSDTIKSVLTEIPSILQGIGMAKKPIQNITPTQQIAPVTSGEAPAASGKTELNLDGPEVNQLRGYLNFLKTRALAGQDYESWIDTILNTLDQEQSGMVVNLLDRPYADIAKIDPELMDIRYRTWFEGFFTGLKNALIGNGAADGLSIDATDVTSDASIVSESGGKIESDT